MKSWLAAFTTALLGFASLGHAQAPLASLQSVHALTNVEAAHHVPVDFEATVTFYRSYERTLFVQDGKVAIYVQPRTAYKLLPGDRIRIQGNTQPSFRPFVDNAIITVIAHGKLPSPIATRFADLVSARDDCMYVTVRGRVLSADIALSSSRRSTLLRVLSDGGILSAEVESDDDAALANLLDANVAVTGAVSGLFDGKMEMTGIVIHSMSLKDVKVLHSADASPWMLPITPMDKILSAYHEISQSHRVRVQGTITYYVPDLAVVLQNGQRSLWINTHERRDLKLGDQADATGFPDIRDGFLKLRDAEVLDSQVAAPISPVAVTWNDLAHSHHVFDLVSIEGEIVAAVREAGQDNYELISNGHLFTAIMRHPLPGTGIALPAMRRIKAGSRVRVTGICTLEDSNPFNNDVPFDVLLRNYDDIAVIAKASPISVDNLMRVVTALVVIVLLVSIWGWMLKRKVARQTNALASRVKSEAALARRNAQMEQRRSRILEDINGTRPLAELLEEITEFVSFQLDGAPCWCEISDGARLGRYSPDVNARRIVQQEIVSRTGARLGILYAVVQAGDPTPEEHQAFFVATRLATLAIETRRMYTDLVHRSEFDLLTDVHNRFSLERQLDAVITRAREQARIFGLIYIDLDEFKQVNDIYGHRVGDQYLQAVCARMKHQLRIGDLLARLGGDEFATLVAEARSRTDVEEIARRLERCFDEPFRVGGHVLRGTASIGIAIYPEDGNNKDNLLSAADAAMYVAKHTRREMGSDGLGIAEPSETSDESDP